MALPSGSQLSDQLFGAAQARAQQHGLVFDGATAAELKKMTDDAAKIILTAAQAKTSSLQDQYARGAARVASEAMMTLVDEMTSARFRLPGYPVQQNDLDLQTLKSARDVFCPIWPIC
ncbi:hypothetical protein [Bradyrhizobium embrapense]